MKKRFTLILGLAIACSFLTSSSAQAQYGLGCNGYGGFGIYDIGRLYRVLADNVPYYAAFPPVYYSVPVPRTYGYSPFAYPPGVMTPEVVDASPQEVINPHMDPLPEPNVDAASSDHTTQVESSPMPLAIYNPFVVGPSGEDRLTILPTSELDR